MMHSSAAIKKILAQLKRIREREGIAAGLLEERLILGPGWITQFESGESIPDLETLIALCKHLGVDAVELFKGIDYSSATIPRKVIAEQQGSNLLIHFNYNQFDAEYILQDATVEQLEGVIKVLRDNLSRLDQPKETEVEAIKTDAVAKTFTQSVRTWPHANPSDLWWFLIYRAYCDPFNHPAKYSGLSFEQSWKRTGGWALEEILFRHYGPFLSSKGIRLSIGTAEEKDKILKEIKVKERLEADKIDVLILGKDKTSEKFLGVVHVKASFAERRTDDVPMSRALI